MLYLSSLMVSGRSREARGDLGNCQALHRRVLHAFPDGADVTAARERFGVLYRVEPVDGGARILVLSREKPDWSRLPEAYLRGAVADPKRVDEAYARLAVNDELVFRLRANPTRRISNRNMSAEEKWRGKRVDIRGEDAQIAWLRDKGKVAGFALLAVRSRTDATDSGEVPNVRTVQVGGSVTGGVRERRLTFASVTFEGRLRVTNPEAFRQALMQGIGSGKAFGFGLLSIAPVPA